MALNTACLSQTTSESPVKIEITDKWIYQWRELFGTLTPIEAIILTWHIMVPDKVWTHDKLKEIVFKIKINRRLPTGFSNDFLHQKEHYKITEHHIIPRSRGGSNYHSNIVGLDKLFHHLWHIVFINMTPEEAMRYIRANRTIIANYTFKKHCEETTEEFPEKYLKKSHLQIIHTGKHGHSEK